MIKANDFAHVAIRITDVERSKKFYENVIGLKTIPRPQIRVPGEWYGVGGNQLHLIQSKARDGIDPLGPHMAFEVEDFEAVKKALDEAGIPYLDGSRTNMVSVSPEAQRLLGQQLWVKDPDGNVVELRKSAS